MLAYKVVTAGKYKGASLEELCFELLGVEIEKEEQISDWLIPGFTESQPRYAAKNATLLLPLQRVLTEEVLSNMLYQVAKLEFETLEPTVEI